MKTVLKGLRAKKVLKGRGAENVVKKWKKAPQQKTVLVAATPVCTENSCAPLARDAKLMRPSWG